jgi:predicted HD phosphohydrolase
LTDKRAKFTNMHEITADDCKIIAFHLKEFSAGLADRILDHMKLLDGDYGGYAVHRLGHSLQTATRAYRDGRAEDYVVCALLHDIGDMLASHNHADLAAAIVKPFASEELHWIIEKHAIFQGYYFFHMAGFDRNERDKYRGHPAFEACAEFCEKYDQAAFDPNYENMPLSAFEPMVRRFFASPRRNMSYLRPRE